MTRKTKRGVRMEEIPAAERELAPEQAEGTKGGFNPQPEPPRETIEGPHINPPHKGKMGAGWLF